MACFTCGEGKNISTIDLLLLYKEASKKSGVTYWFFSDKKDNEIKIMSNDDFAEFKRTNKKAFSKGEIEFARIDEFEVIKHS